MRNTDELPDDALEALFAVARTEVPLPSGALMDRLRDTALAEQPRPVVRRARRGPVSALIEAIGGWPALAGLATAGVMGLWIGANPPQALTGLLVASDLTALAPYDLSLLDEEG